MARTERFTVWVICALVPVAACSKGGGVVNAMGGAGGNTGGTTNTGGSITNTGGATDKDASSSAGRGGTASPNAPLHYCKVAAASAHTYYVATNGDDKNDGSKSAPWASIEHATASIASGDSVLVSAGIYRIPDNLAFGPKGTGHDALTTFAAEDGARVILTSATGFPPNAVGLHDYVRLERLWFGGERVPDAVQGCDINAINVGSSFFLSNLDASIGTGKQIVGCTFFSYSEVGLGTNQDVVFADNRFVRTGRNCHAHPIYISGGADNPSQIAAGECSQHIIVDRNIFVSNEGWSMHGFHRPFSGIVTRNFVGTSYRGFVWDGTDVFVANNFFWKETGVTGVPPATSLGPGGALLYSGHSHAVVVNNVFGPTSPFEGDFVSTDVVENNAFLGVTARGNASVTLNAGDEAKDFGISAADLDAAIAALTNDFTQPVDNIYANKSIEAEFAKLRFSVGATSALSSTGIGWSNDGTRVDIGPSLGSSSCIEDLWSAFHAWSLRDVDRYAKLPDGSSP